MGSLARELSTESASKHLQKETRLCEGRGLKSSRPDLLANEYMKATRPFRTTRSERKTNRGSVLWPVALRFATASAAMLIERRQPPFFGGAEVLFVIEFNREK